MKKAFLLITLLVLVATSAMAKTVSLSWDASPSVGVTNYDVYMSTTPGELVQGQMAPDTLTPVYSTPDLGATLEDLTDSTVYYFGVDAGDGTIHSALSNIVYSPAVFLPPTGLGGNTVIQNLAIPLE